MPRTPKPADSVKRSFDISEANNQWLYRLAEERKRSFAEVLNSEIEYVRTFGLPLHFIRRLAIDAEAKGTNLRLEVQTLAMDMAAKLEKYTGPLPVVPPPNERRRSGANFNGPNDMFVLRTANHEKLEWSAALQRILDFARTYGLPPEPLARLEREAKLREVSVRDLLAEQLILAALKLSDPPRAASTSAPVRKARKA